MSDPQFYLASQSPRRRELLAQIGLVPALIGAEVDETPLPSERADHYVERLARAKALAGWRAVELGVLAPLPVLGADTAVVIDGEILGKPRDVAEAHTMLRALRGRYHNVFTGFTIADGRVRETELVHSRVLMRNFSDAEIESYVASGDPFDKAAGYAIQHENFSPVERVEGCVANVMGLPLCRLYHALVRHSEMPVPSLACTSHPETKCSVAFLFEK